MISWKGDPDSEGTKGDENRLPDGDAPLALAGDLSPLLSGKGILDLCAEEGTGENLLPWTSSSSLSRPTVQKLKSVSLLVSNR